MNRSVRLSNALLCLTVFGLPLVISSSPMPNRSRRLGGGAKPGALLPLRAGQRQVGGPQSSLLRSPATDHHP